MVEQFVGNWRMTSSENFDDYMKAIGVGFGTRQVASKLKPNLRVSVDATAGTITMRSRSMFKTVEIRFRLGEEFDETTADNRHVRSLITLENGNKLVQRQTWDGNSTTLEREIRDGKLIVKCVMGDVVAIRTYEREA